LASANGGALEWCLCVLAQKFWKRGVVGEDVMRLSCEELQAKS
jgi:hypothetical protein